MHIHSTCTCYFVFFPLVIFVFRHLPFPSLSRHASFLYNVVLCSFGGGLLREDTVMIIKVHNLIISISFHELRYIDVINSLRYMLLSKSLRYMLVIHVINVINVYIRYILFINVLRYTILLYHYVPAARGLSTTRRLLYNIIQHEYILYIISCHIISCDLMYINIHIMLLCYIVSHASTYTDILTSYTNKHIHIILYYNIPDIVLSCIITYYNMLYFMCYMHINYHKHTILYYYVLHIHKYTYYII